MKWIQSNLADTARVSDCGRFAIARVMVNTKRIYELWHDKQRVSEHASFDKAKAAAELMREAA